MVKLRMRRVMLTIEERRYVPRKGQSILPCSGGDSEVNRTKMIPYTKTEESK